MIESVNLSALSDERLAELAKTNPNALETLIERYKKAVRSISRRYFLTGGEEDDLIQEGTIGLFKAITSFNGGVFKNYAFTCIKSSIISLVRKSTSGKNRALLYYVPISAFGFDDDEDKNAIVKDVVSGPEEEYINYESANEFMARVKTALSKYEYDILKMYLDGYSYAEIAKELGTNSKSVDNAVQRIRKKISNVNTQGGK